MWSRLVQKENIFKFNIKFEKSWQDTEKVIEEGRGGQVDN